MPAAADPEVVVPGDERAVSIEVDADGPTALRIGRRRRAGSRSEGASRQRPACAGVALRVWARQPRSSDATVKPSSRTTSDAALTATYGQDAGGTGHAAGTGAFRALNARAVSLSRRIVPPKSVQ